MCGDGPCVLHIVSVSVRWRVVGVVCGVGGTWCAVWGGICNSIACNICG